MHQQISSKVSRKDNQADTEKASYLWPKSKKTKNKEHKNGVVNEKAHKKWLENSNNSIKILKSLSNFLPEFAAEQCFILFIWFYSIKWSSCEWLYAVMLWMVQCWYSVYGSLWKRFLRPIKYNENALSGHNAPWH